MTAANDPVALHVAPHPDDEALGAPGALLRLQSTGWRVVNLAVGLGRPEQHERRRQELMSSTAVSGFNLRIADPAASISSGDDLAAAEVAVAGQLIEVIGDLNPNLIVGPSAFDPHHGHACVGRALVRAVETLGLPTPLWLWNIWGMTEPANLFIELSPEHMFDARRMLSCHAGELRRSDLVRLLAARCDFHAAVGVERVLGFGASAPRSAPVTAHLLTEVRLTAAGWVPARPRMVGLDTPLEPEVRFAVDPVGVR